MAPPPVSKSDATAVRLLSAAASLIDDHVSAAGRRDRLPHVLMWLTESRVSRAAGVGRGALRRRWAGMDDFVRDAALHALTYADREKLGRPSFEATPARHSATFAADVAASSSLVELVADTADQVLDELVADPRSYLLAHLVPLLAGRSSAGHRLDAAINADQRAWENAFQVLLDKTGVLLRPGWTVHSVTLALQALLDGFVLRTRAQADEYSFVVGGDRPHSLCADTVLAFLLAVLDLEHSRRDVYAELAQRWTPGTEQG